MKILTKPNGENRIRAGKMTLWVKKNWRPEIRFQNQASHRRVCLVIVELLWRLGCRINRL